MRLILQIFIGVVLGGVAGAMVEACSVPPRHMYLDHRAAIQDAGWIARVRPVRRIQEDNRSGYRLEVVEYLKGEGPNVIEVETGGWGDLPAQAHSTEPAAGNDYGHSLSQFWLRGGRGTNAPDCEIHPSFRFAGNEYLLFGPLDYNLGFENIALEDDAWLQFVRDELAGVSTLPFPVEFSELLGRAEAILHVEAEWRDGHVYINERVLKGDRESYLETIHPIPEAYFDSMLDWDCIAAREGVPRDRIPASRSRVERIYVLERIPTEVVMVNSEGGCVLPSGEPLSQWWDRSQVRIEARGVFAIREYLVFNLVDGQIQLNTEFFHRWSRDPILDGGQAIEALTMPEFELLLEGAGP
jgi:hypothetical protein